MRRICAFLLGLASCIAAAGTPEIYITRTPEPGEIDRNFTNAKFEPRLGCYLGAYIDLDSTLQQTFIDQTKRPRKLPDPFEELTGRRHASYFFYLGYGTLPPNDWIRRLHGRGNYVHIALEPNNGLEFVRDDEYLQMLALQFQATGAKIFLRFASEMNGNWLAWHGNPPEYVEKFRLVTRVMRRWAPNVAMVWCPYALPDGNIDSYYPGDEHVDWVGVNIYNVTFLNQDRRTPGSQIGPAQLLEPIYRRYAARKPIMIGEYGATHFSALEGVDQTQFALDCIGSLYAGLPRRFPRVKAIFYFNTSNLEIAHARNNNYAVTQNPKVLEVYRRLIADPWFLDSNRTGLTATRWPMPAAANQLVNAPAEVSAWADVHEPGDRLILRFGRRVAYDGPSCPDWRGELLASDFTAGKCRIEATVMRGRRILSSKAVTVSLAGDTRPGRTFGPPPGG